MDCPIDKSSMSRMGMPHYDGTGDVYTYYWCRQCECQYEVVEDELWGGAPTIKPVSRR